jgi:hypothetical protein
VTEEKGKNVDRQTEEALYSRDRAASTLDSLLFSEYLYTCQNLLELLFVYWAREPWLGKEEKFSALKSLKFFHSFRHSLSSFVSFFSFFRSCFLFFLTPSEFLYSFLSLFVNFSFYALGPLACSNLELTSDSESLRHWVELCGRGIRFSEDKIPKNRNILIHLCLEWDSFFACLFSFSSFFKSPFLLFLCIIL